jgi:hypothetical protein
MSLNIPAKEVSISTVNCMGCEQWRFGRWNIMQDIARLRLLCLWQSNGTATAWHGAPLDAAIALNKCLGNKNQVPTIIKALQLFFINMNRGSGQNV